jgi:transcriptional regulator with XRE-family HTH domain
MWPSWPARDMTASEISNIELGRRGLPKPPRMIAIARAFGVHVCDLYVAAGFPEFGAYRDERRIEENALAGEDVPTA